MFFKGLKQDGRSPVANWSWPLPDCSGPGRWTPHIEGKEPIRCVRGYHFCDEDGLTTFMDDRIFLLEVDSSHGRDEDTIYHAVNGEFVTTRPCRLVKELNWSKKQSASMLADLILMISRRAPFHREVNEAISGMVDALHVFGYDLVRASTVAKCASDAAITIEEHRRYRNDVEQMRARKNLQQIAGSIVKHYKALNHAAMTSLVRLYAGWLAHKQSAEMEQHSYGTTEVVRKLLGHLLDENDDRGCYNCRRLRENRSWPNRMHAALYGKKRFQCSMGIVDERLPEKALFRGRGITCDFWLSEED